MLTQRKFIVFLLVVIAGIYPLQSYSSDWVEGNTNQFQTQPQTAPPEPRPTIQPSFDLSPSTDKEANSYDNAIKVNDPGAGEFKSSRKNAPLEANVSRSETFVDIGDHGLGRRAAWLMSQARLGTPPATRSVSPKFYSGWIESTYPNLKINNHKAIVEIKGEWDNAGHALHSFGLPSIRVGSGKELENALSTASILIVNCAGDLPEESLTMIGNFVHEGGYLITTDWALNGCLSHAVPGYVAWNGGYSSDELVDAVEVDKDSDLFAGTVPYAFWKLDNKCQTVKVLKPNAVHVLVRSTELMNEDPDELGVLALTFQFGKGQVLHLVGHFDNNTNLAFTNSLPDPAPRIQISLRQAIAANFVIEALKAHNEIQN
jgi:hypothetical protein